MKYFLLLLLFTSFSITAQDLEQCGLDDNPVLTDIEAKVLNEFYTDFYKKHSEENYSYDFTGKKVIFVTGSGASQIGTKSKYFNDMKLWAKSGSTIAGTGVHILTEEEKVKSGGYDVIVCYWVKVMTKRRQRRIIKEVGKANNVEFKNQSSK